MIPEKAFILAAGLGTRMRPLTDGIPKPLISVGGETLLDRTLDHLQQAGVKDVVLNTHYLGDKITEHLRTRSKPQEITISHEETLLDTGGGIKKMLQHFGDEAFYVLAGDGLWSDGPGAPALQQIAAAWNPYKMDILILLQPVESMKLTRGIRDYAILPNGRAVRSHDKTGTHMFTSMRINHPRIFTHTAEGPFSYLGLLDRAENAGRLYALEHDGAWHHLSTPADVAAVEKAFKRGAA